MKNKFKKITLLFLFVFIMSSGFQCTINPFAKKPAQLNPVKLTVWGVYENNDDLKILFDKYTQIHPTISFEYRKFRPDEYEKQLLEAWAEDRGPDIYFLPNNIFCSLFILAFSRSIIVSISLILNLNLLFSLITSLIV